VSSLFRQFALNFRASCLTVGICRSRLIIQSTLAKTRYYLLHPKMWTNLIWINFNSM